MAQIDNLQIDAAAVPLEGGWIALPLVAVLGGAWAYSRSHIMGTPAQMALAAALVVGGWQMLWHAMARTDWATPLGQWKGWARSSPVPVLPYQQPDAPGIALHQRLSHARGWWQEVGRVSLRTPLQRAALALLVSLLLGVALGRLALLLTLCFLALTELAVLWHEGDGDVGALWFGVTLAGLPWFLGATLSGEDLGLPAVTAVAVALLVGLYAQHSWLAVTGPVVAAVLLIALGLSMAAGWLLLLALPGLIVLSASDGGRRNGERRNGSQPSPSAYRLAIGPWVIAMIILLAWVL